MKGNENGEHSWPNYPLILGRSLPIVILVCAKISIGWGYEANDFWTENVLQGGIDSLETLLPQTKTTVQIQNLSDTSEQILSRAQVNQGPVTAVARWNTQDSLALQVRQIRWATKTTAIQVGDLCAWNDAPFLEGPTGGPRYSLQSSGDRWWQGTGAYPNGIDADFSWLRSRVSLRSRGELAPNLAWSSWSQANGFSVGMRHEIKPSRQSWVQIGLSQNLSGFAVNIQHAQHAYPWKSASMATQASISGDVGDLQTRTELLSIDTSFSPEGLRKESQGVHQIRSEWTLPWQWAKLGLRTESGWDSLEQIRLRIAPRLQTHWRWLDAHLSGRWSRRDTSALAHLRTGFSVPLPIAQPWIETGINPQDAPKSVELATGLRWSHRTWTGDVRWLRTTSGEQRWSFASELQSPRKQLPFQLRLELERRPLIWNTRGELSCVW